MLCLLVMQLWDSIQSPLEGSVPVTGISDSASASGAVNGTNTISNPRPRIIVIGATNRPQVSVSGCVCVLCV